jgi:flagellar biosynthesis protein
MKKTKIAAALKYTENDSAPVLTAFGEGRAAERMVEIATEAGVPLYSDEKLAEKLKKVETGREIPPELYEVVAEILSFVYYLNQKEGEGEYGLKKDDRQYR